MTQVPFSSDVSDGGPFAVFFRKRGPTRANFDNEIQRMGPLSPATAQHMSGCSECKWGRFDSINL